MENAPIQWQKVSDNGVPQVIADNFDPYSYYFSMRAYLRGTIYTLTAPISDYDITGLENIHGPTTLRRGAVVIKKRELGIPTLYDGLIQELVDIEKDIVVKMDPSPYFEDHIILNIAYPSEEKKNRRTRILNVLLDRLGSDAWSKIRY